MPDLLAGETLWRMAIEASDGSACLFIQDAPFVRNGDRYTAPFTCYPPFAGAAPFELSRSRLVITADAARLLHALGSRTAVLRRLGRAVRQRLTANANCTELVIEPEDLADIGQLSAHS
jgi:hypothetical protein